MNLAISIWCFLFCFTFSVMADPDSDEWRLVWQDDFQRVEPGDGWYVVQGDASIVDGRLKLEGDGAIILINRSFAPDVRLEFDAEADPARPPCDLSATLAI